MLAQASSASFAARGARDSVDVNRVNSGLKRLASRWRHDKRCQERKGGRTESALLRYPDAQQTPPRTVSAVELASKLQVPNTVTLVLSSAQLTVSLFVAALVGAAIARLSLTYGLDVYAASLASLVGTAKKLAVVGYKSACRELRQNAEFCLKNAIYFLEHLSDMLAARARSEDSRGML
ncbi:hypothetical protein NMY22_g18748 [Coprinellus aureogranulatus]|nr:hypothetical protein NMY22_g18748 [Coprinellus aureogranulatus]